MKHSISLDFVIDNEVQSLCLLMVLNSWYFKVSGKDHFKLLFLNSYKWKVCLSGSELKPPWTVWWFHLSSIRTVWCLACQICLLPGRPDSQACLCGHRPSDISCQLKSEVIYLFIFFSIQLGELLQIGDSYLVSWRVRMFTFLYSLKSCHSLE